VGRIARLLSFARTVVTGANVSDVQFDPDGGANRTGQHFADIGEDAHPLPDDWVVTVNTQRTGVEVVIGYVDPKNDQTARPGEKRTYARDANGEQVAHIWIQNDGRITASNNSASWDLKPTGEVSTVNGSGYHTLHADGRVQINDGAVFDTAGVLTCPNVVYAGVSAKDHWHNQPADSDGDAEKPTDPPQSGPKP